MRPSLRHALMVVPLLCAVGCASGPRPGYMEPPRPREGLEWTDLVGRFVTGMKALRAEGRDLDQGWREYEAHHRELFESAGAAAGPEDAADRAALCAELSVVLDHSAAFDRDARGELPRMSERFERTFGSLPRLTVVLAVAVPDRAFFSGERDGRPVLLLNGRHPELSTSSRREALLARELFRAWHAQRTLPSGSLAVVATHVYREGAVAFAARQLAPGSSEADVLGLTETQLSAARKRERLIARELLASIDSASTTEAARFFDPSVKDPLVPPGGGAFVSDRLYQRLASEAGSAAKPLLLTPQDFLSRARKHLLAMASARD